MTIMASADDQVIVRKEHANGATAGLAFFHGSDRPNLPGLPATTAIGSGAQGMSDRLAALGGSLDVFAALGHGTRVTGRVPATTATPAPVTTAAENPLAARTTDRSG